MNLHRIKKPKLWNRIYPKVNTPFEVYLIIFSIFHKADEQKE